MIAEAVEIIRWRRGITTSNHPADEQLDQLVGVLESAAAMQVAAPQLREIVYLNGNRRERMRRCLID